MFFKRLGNKSSQYFTARTLFLLQTGENAHKGMSLFRFAPT